MAIVALQETKLPFCDKINTKNYQLLYRDDDNRHYTGVDFAIKKRDLKSVLKFVPIS